jgi:hypothetical protein
VFDAFCKQIKLEIPMFTIRLSFCCSILFLFLLPHNIFAQVERSQVAKNDVFSELLSEVEALGNNPGRRAETVARWVQQQSFSSLPWQKQVGLLPLLEAPDRVDTKSMSVRWLGRISVPVDGQYTFEQLRTDHMGGTMKLWINDNLVLDGSRATSSENLGDTAFRSMPVLLQAGTLATFRLEYVRDAREMPTGFPIVVLMWESEVMEQRIVSKEVFRQPAGNQHGLRGEYFADAHFGRKIGDRIDESIEFIWDQGAVFNAYNGLRRQIVQSLLSRLTNAAFLSEIDDDDLEQLAEKGLVALLATATASERSALIAVASSQPRLLKSISYKVLADQVQSVFMLPDLPHFDFLVRWSEANEVPPFEPGTMVSGWGTYAVNNINPYWRIGRHLGESHTQELDDLVDRHLQNEDGSCNLGMTYIVVSAYREHNRLGWVLNRIDEALSDAELSGDAKASWYLAKAFALETAVQPMIKPARGIPELRNALAVAECDEFRSRIQQEIVARLLTLGRDEEAKNVLSTQQNRMAVSAGRPILGNDPISGFQERYAAAALRRQALSHQHYINSVKKHQSSARLKNDTAQVVRLQNILSDFETKQQSEKK